MLRRGSLVALALFLAGWGGPGLSRFGSVTSENGVIGEVISRPRSSGNPTCVAYQSDANIGRARLISLAGEGFLPTTATKGSHVAAGTGLVMQPEWNWSTASPTCTADCFGLQSDLATQHTCYAPSESASLPNARRGVRNALNIAAQVTALKATAATQRSGGDPPKFSIYLRPDLVDWATMQVSGFDETFLVQTSDRAAFDSWLALTGGASWSWSYVVNGKDVYTSGSDLGGGARQGGVRVLDQIATLGGTPTTYAYYMTRPTAYPFYPDAAIADLTNSSYRAWRIALAQLLYAQSGVDYIEVSSKFGQHQANTYAVDFCATPEDARQMYLGNANKCGDNLACTGSGTPSACCTALDTGTCQSEESTWTGDLEGAGYGYAEYVEGLRLFVAELKAAGVPYAWNSNGGEWKPSGHSAGYGCTGAATPAACCTGAGTGTCPRWDDASTVADERNSLREMFDGAAFVILSRNCATCFQDGLDRLAVTGQPFAVTQ